jgi:alpha-L-arabinofuranosidase
MKVTAPDGKVLLASDFSANSDGWKKLGEGNWAVKDGALQQNQADREFVRALAGDKSWTDYTLELKARKISGREGFLIMFHIGSDDDRVWWNLGGWENTANAIELGETMDSKRGRIETGRWYDIKIEVRGMSIKCSLDGKVVHDIKNSRSSMKSLFASATRETKSGDIIVKVVNGAAMPMETTINLNGAGKLGASAQAIVLTSESPKDENTLENPTKVSPKMETLKIGGSTFTRSFPGNSFTILRIPGAK